MRSVVRCLAQRTRSRCPTRSPCSWRTSFRATSISCTICAGAIASVSSTRCAAPSGTPVHAAAAGKVVFAGQQGGYGNVVMLQHGGAYSTVYAHLSRFAPGIKPGARTSQGNVIGYVGMTGWATGPHLHYEFRVDNVQRNPLTIALPNAQPIPSGQKAAFQTQVLRLADELALGRGVILAGGE